MERYVCVEQIVCVFAVKLFSQPSCVSLQCILLLAFWGAGLPVLMNPNRGIAVEGEEVVNANLYFFSWLSLAAVVYIAASLLEEYGISVRQVAANNAKAGRWYGLAASSMIVMVSSVRLFVSKNCSNDIWTGTETCKRTKFGISMGVISFVWAFGLGFMMHKVSKFLELASSTMLLTLWCFGVGFITFGESPGARIGNLYFSTWISFIIIVFLFAQVFRDFMSARSQGAEEEPKEEGEGEHDLEMHNSSSPEVPPEDDI